ncbi:hypothetical protein [Paenibacillus sp. KS-LC4]|uniref:hypothetical protein n=1 Tax=Paenibacillus sp. KS-LC4 TaxID=2979727 RepID=UPI0030D05B7C
MEQSAAVKLIEDYKLEELLRCPYRFIKRQTAKKRAGEVNGRQLMQFAVSHIVNDFYELPPHARTANVVKRLAERWWTPRVAKFDNAEHYWDAKLQAIVHLTAFLLEEQEAAPIIQFEQHRTFVEPLDMELTQIFQIVAEDPYGTNTDYIVQKFVVDEDEDVIVTFQHMTAVFCDSAFGKLPSRIDVLSVMSGQRISYYPSEADIAQSLDYMRLVQTMLPEAEWLRKSNNEAECRSCPLRSECFSKTSEAATEAGRIKSASLTM